MLEKQIQTNTNANTNITNTKSQKLKSHTNHPDHSDSLPRLKKIQGQIEGIMNMVSDGRYCIDLIMQLRAAASALKSVEGQVIERHLRGCIHNVMKNKNSEEINKKVEELMNLYMRGL